MMELNLIQLFARKLWPIHRKAINKTVHKQACYFFFWKQKLLTRMFLPINIYSSTILSQKILAVPLSFLCSRFLSLSQALSFWQRLQAKNQILEKLLASTALCTKDGIPWLCDETCELKLKLKFSNVFHVRRIVRLWSKTTIDIASHLSFYPL